MNKWNPFRDTALIKRQAILAVCLIFVVAGISGWVYEELFYRINDGYFSRRGHGIGPWLPIYAFGMAILLFATAPVKNSKWKTVLLCAGISGGFEYLVGWVLYRFFDGLRLWDYNTERWNWGNIGVIEKLAKKLPDWAYTLITAVPFALFVIDIIQGYMIKGL